MKNYLALLAFASVVLAQAAQDGSYVVTVGPGNSYTPSVITVPTGATVQFKFAGGQHTATHSDGNCNRAASPVFDLTNTGNVTFQTAGTYPFYSSVGTQCTTDGMRGVVTVTGSGGPSPSPSPPSGAAMTQKASATVAIAIVAAAAVNL